MRISFIVAMTRGGLMGRDGGMPWHWPEDLRHFRRTTRGHMVLMGRRTWSSLDGPLPQRVNITVSRSVGRHAGAAGLDRDGARWFASLDAALAWAGEQDRDGELFILGGAEVFADVLKRATLPQRMVVTWVPDVAPREGDVLFPRDEAWIDTHYDVVDERTGETGDLRFVTYTRRRA